MPKPTRGGEEVNFGELQTTQMYAYARGEKMPVWAVAFSWTAFRPKREPYWVYHDDREHGPLPPSASSGQLGKLRTTTLVVGSIRTYSSPSPVPQVSSVCSTPSKISLRLSEADRQTRRNK